MLVLMTKKGLMLLLS